MRSKDITKYVVAIHRQESLNQLLQDTVDELANGVPDLLINELNGLMKKIDIEGLYVDEEGIEAEGSGKLLDNVDSSDNAGKVTLNIITKE